MKYLITGAAGFIGMHTAKRLLEEGHEVVGLDNLNEYYDVRLKHYRLDQLTPYPSFRFTKMDLADREGITSLHAPKNNPAGADIIASRVAGGERKGAAGIDVLGHNPLDELWRHTQSSYTSQTYIFSAKIINQTDKAQAA